jgi:hypothetical protein
MPPKPNKRIFELGENEILQAVMVFKLDEETAEMSVDNWFPQEEIANVRLMQLAIALRAVADVIEARVTLSDELDDFLENPEGT